LHNILKLLLLQHAAYCFTATVPVATVDTVGTVENREQRTVLQRGREQRRDRRKGEGRNEGSNFKVRSEKGSPGPDGTRGVRVWGSWVMGLGSLGRRVHCSSFFVKICRFLISFTIFALFE
jgi:hypothetical protein